MTEKIQLVTGALAEPQLKRLSGDPATLASQVRDPNYRIEVAEDDIHIYNCDGHIDVRADVGRAFYFGLETARAEIAFRLGKRYTQDEPSAFAIVSATKGSADEAHRLTFKEAGTARQQPRGPKPRSDERLGRFGRKHGGHD